MGCGASKPRDVIVPTTKVAASTTQTPSKSSQPAVQPSKKPKKEETSKPIEYRTDPNLTEEEREQRRLKLAQATEERLKQESQKGMTKEGTVEYSYMVKHQKDLEKYKKLDDGKNLDWTGS